MLENQEQDKKSLGAINGRNPDWDEIAKDCVAFANASGGKLLIGIEDDADEPHAAQRVPSSLVEALGKAIPQRTMNVTVAPSKVTAPNGGEYIELAVFRSQAIAGTSDGKYYIRSSDSSRPLLPDEIGRLMTDKGAFTWETQTPQRVSRDSFDQKKLDSFLVGIRSSDRVTRFVKDKTTEEILDYYLFARDGYLTNLGILWIGRREDRANLLYAPVIQFIKYDENDRKVSKLDWDDFTLNPLEMVEAVWRDIPDWKEGEEVSDGLFRKSIPNYDEAVVRELVANALVHRPYTMRGDIFLNLHVDRLEVHNPGLLPLGVTPENILHTSMKRNEHLAKVFYDLRLMEREGSGFDRMYEVLLASGKRTPEVAEGRDRVSVTVRKRIANREVIAFIYKASDIYDLKQKEIITLGLIAQHGALSAIELSRKLDLPTAYGLREWLGRLMKFELVESKGQTKGTEYFIKPDLLRTLEFKGQTNLKAIEPHRLKELILQDLKIYRKAGIGEIHGRVGKEIPRHKIQRILWTMVEDGIVDKDGVRKGTKYFLTQTP